MGFKTILILPIILFAVLLPIGCQIQNTEPYDIDQNEMMDGLTSFLPQTPQGYNGDNGYYHVATNVEMIKNENTGLVAGVILTGEVLNNSLGSVSSDYHFEQTYTIEEEGLILVNLGQKLNDSDFERVIILRYPIAIDDEWSFKTHRDGMKVEVDAKVIAMTQDTVTVNYSDNKGYRELRVLSKGLGTTDFYKYYQYDDLVVVTGYHLDANYIFQNLRINPDLKAFEDTVSRRVPYKMHELITAYNLAYEAYINDGDQGILKYLDTESRLHEVLKNLESLDQKIDFVGFKVLKTYENGHNDVIDVLEGYFLEDDFITTYTTYEMTIIDGEYYIVDAYATK